MQFQITEPISKNWLPLKTEFNGLHNEVQLDPLPCKTSRGHPSMPDSGLCRAENRLKILYP